MKQELQRMYIQLKERIERINTNKSGTDLQLVELQKEFDELKQRFAVRKEKLEERNLEYNRELNAVELMKNNLKNTYNEMYVTDLEEDIGDAQPPDQQPEDMLPPEEMEEYPPSEG